MPCTNRTESLIESLSISFSVLPPGFGAVTRISSRSRSVRSLANASSRVAMPFIGASALAIARIRPGTRGSVGGWKPSSTPSSRTCIRAGSTPKSLAMSRLDASDGVRMKRACWATFFCIRRKPYQRLSRELAPRVLRRGDVDAPVEGDRVVDRGQERQPHLLDLEHPVAEHLVVVGDVEVVHVGPAAARATRELNVLGSGKPGHAHRGELLDVDPVAELAQLAAPGTGPARGRGRGSAPW